MEKNILQNPISDLISPSFKTRITNEYFDDDRQFANFVVNILKINDSALKQESLFAPLIVFSATIADKIGFCFNSVLKSYAENRLGKPIKEDEEDLIEKSNFNDFSQHKGRQKRQDAQELLNLCDFLASALKISKTAFLREFLIENTPRIIEIFTTAYDLENFNPVSERMQVLQEFTEMTNDEVAFLNFAMLMSSFPILGDTWISSNMLNRFRFLDKILGIAPKSYANIEADIGALRKFNIIESESFYEIFNINPKVNLYLRGIIDSFYSTFAIEKEINESFPLNSFDLPKDSITIIKKLLESNKPCKILIYGEPGLGKTEFLKAIIRSTKKNMILPVEDKLNAILRADFMASKTNNVAVFDECDDILNAFLPKEKTDINRALDSMCGKSIWVSNYISRIDSSTKRRFSYSIKFSGITKENSEAVLHSALADCDFGNYISINEVNAIAKTYSLSIGEISQAVRNTGVIIDHLDDPKKILCLIENFAQSQSVLNGTTKFKRRSANSKKSFAVKNNRLSKDIMFDSRALNIDFDYSRLLSAIKNYKNALLEEEATSSMNLVFAGVPGTGKTELARHIASELDMPIVVKTMSSLLDKYIGETEKNIADAFAEAEDKKAILVIDEADVLFNDRRNATRPWEISMVNEMLTQIERFRGIFIATTNLMQNFDQAAMRRFQKKINFDCLKEDAKKLLFLKYFCNEDDVLEAQTISSLNNMPQLTAGDFKNVSTQIAFEGIALSQAEIISLLEREVSFKDGSNSSKKLGFF